MTLPDDSSPREERPRKSARWARMWPWAIAALILAATYVLVLVPGIEPREWAAEVVFVAAHLVAAEVIVSGHRRE